MDLFLNCAHIHIGQHIRCPALFVVLPVWVVLTLLFISNTASLVAKVSLRLPGSWEHLGGPDPGARWCVRNPPKTCTLQHWDANVDIKEGEPAALSLGLFVFVLRIISKSKNSVRKDYSLLSCDRLWLFLHFLSKLGSRLSGHMSTSRFGFCTLHPSIHDCSIHSPMWAESCQQQLARGRLKNRLGCCQNKSMTYHNLTFKLIYRLHPVVSICFVI